MESKSVFWCCGILIILVLSPVYGFSFQSLFETKAQFEKPAWGYKCEGNLCKKVKLSEDNTAVSLDVCRLACGQDIGTLWPKPTVRNVFKKDIEQIDPAKIQFNFDVYLDPKYWETTEARFRKQLDAKKPANIAINSGGAALFINPTIKSNNLHLSMTTSEVYTATSRKIGKDIHFNVSTDTFYGFRHSLETLSQLIVYDSIENNYKMLIDCDLRDDPKFKHRGVTLDTSRNYFTKESILRTIDGMAMVKMNVFHWHITDSHSFPVVIKSQPDLSKNGAYSPEQIYTREDVKEIVEFAKIRGIRVIPEFDAPAHVGEGWQGKNVTMCFGIQPWSDYCVEPPCGQFDPSKDELYNILEDIYREYWNMFGPVDLFHMGGDEVDFRCWRTSTELKNWMKAKGWGTEDADYMKLWNYFQENALERLDKITGEKLPIILWTSTLTAKPYLSYLDKSRYVIQVWTTGEDPKLQTLLDEGYNVIISNYDALYLDCGFAGWVDDGNNWCSPYIGWQKIYDNSLDAMAGKKFEQVYGAEAALWTEQADDNTIDSRLWPRLSALAERLWTNPKTSWKLADSRMLMHHRRLVENGIQADRLQPEWCTQNERECNAYVLN